MKAAVMKAAVVPSVNGKWEVKQWETPKAGPNQVVIKIHASGPCYTDVHLTHGVLPLQFPRVLGHEPVGEIVELGPGVTTRKVGDRVGVGWVEKGWGGASGVCVARRSCARTTSPSAFRPRAATPSTCSPMRTRPC
jgi:D-arabinose 1-dehydrogenase-like Zn-dependent alcohol dehydrogenase